MIASSHGSRMTEMLTLYLGCLEAMGEAQLSSMPLDVNCLAASSYKGVSHNKSFVLLKMISMSYSRCQMPIPAPTLINLQFHMIVRPSSVRGSLNSSFVKRHLARSPASLLNDRRSPPVHFRHFSSFSCHKSIC